LEGATILEIPAQDEFMAEVQNDKAHSYTSSAFHGSHLSRNQLDIWGV
jgi:hypothetical protein